MHRMSVAEFETALEQCSQLGEHAYIWGDIRARRNVIREQLPDQLRKQTIATGIDARDYQHHDPQEPADAD